MARVGQRERLRMLLLAWVLLGAVPEFVVAQRVQIPTQSAPSTFGPPPASGAVAPPAATIGPPGFDAYGGAAIGSPPPLYQGTPTVPAPGYAVPNYGAPAYPAPTYSAPAQPFAQPYAAQPYAAQPYAAQPYAPAPVAPEAYSGAGSAPWFGDEGVVGWEPGTYQWQSSQGGGVSFTKFMQRFDGEYTHLFGGDAVDDLQLNRVEVTATFAWPIGGNIETPILLTPGFVANFFDFTPIGDEEVYEAFLDAAWLPQFNEVLGAELGVRTGVWTDFHEVNSDSVRVLGRGLAVVRVSPAMEVLAGVVYLDRRRIKLLPAGGVRWRPSDVWQFDAVFPNPVLRRRLRSAGSTQWWGFLAGEYGGGSWTTNLATTGVDYNDVRVSLGLEFETASRVTGSFEVGYVFEREIYAPTGGGPVVINLDETVMLRAGLNL